MESVPYGGTLIPPINFGMVETDLYRSGVPNELSFPFLEKLQLKKILYLAPDEVSQQFLNFVDDQGIELVALGWDGEKSPWKPISEEVVLNALDCILNVDNYPLHVMCNLGRHRTGTVIGCLRKLQRWNLTSIFEEYRRFAGSKVRLLNEQFIELFDTDLVRIPPNYPNWL
ncbi:Probable tyrosine-protein phosphatase [Galdieria sulphuraria]|nr:Probable tyrosine-protein phosphatase [Galdieria sulphuraria]